MPPTGKRVVMRSIDIWRVRDGRLAEHWDELNTADWFAQLQGAEPQPRTGATSAYRAGPGVQRRAPSPRRVRRSRSNAATSGPTAAARIATSSGYPASRSASHSSAKAPESIPSTI